MNILAHIRQRHSLTSSTLRSVAIRISLIVGLTALLSYLHLSGQIERSAMQTLQKYVHERSLREREIFKLAHDNHVVLRNELTEVFRALEASSEDPVAAYDALLQRDPDGALRSPRAKPGEKKELDIWIPRTAKVSPLFRRKVVEFSKVLLRYGPAFHARFTDTYIALRENANLVYWPEFPDWSAGVAADFDFPSYELFSNGELAKNPERTTKWTAVYYDDAVKDWMVTASTPFDDRDGNFAGIIGHDVLVGELIKRTTNEGLPGTYNILINKDGYLIAHPRKMQQVIEAKGALKVADTKDRVLEAIYAEMKRAPLATSGETIIDHDGFDQFIAISHMPETEWDFVTVYPKSLIRAIANKTALFIIMLGLLSLALELGLLYVIFRDKVSAPLQRFIEATHAIEAGEPTVPLQTERKDEIGSLSRSFDSMAHKIRQASDVLRDKLEQRTRELRAVQEIATKNAHAAGKSEIATNILHNIGNTINSVNVSAIEMERLLAEPHLKNLERALKLIEDNRDRLAEFLVNDPKGKLLPPYLVELARAIGANRASSLATFERMSRKITMISDIVVSQQEYVKAGAFSEDVDLRAAITEALGMVNLGKPRENFRLITELAELPPIRSQRVKLMQIVMNLLANALDSIDAVDAAKPKEVEVTLGADGDDIVLTVRDSGLGISAENLQRIFAHGFTTKATGHGFGLHFCANAATELGGSLSVESPGEGHGATFTLRLPRTPA
jgi:signal transduction histidine kinase